MRTKFGLNGRDDITLKLNKYSCADLCLFALVEICTVLLIKLFLLSRMQEGASDKVGKK